MSEYCKNCFELAEKLTKKEQECEELKRKVELMMDCPDCKVDEYKTALEEIKDYCSSKIKSDFDFIEAYTPILNIINKAKGGEDA